MFFFPITRKNQTFWEILTGFILLGVACAVALTAFSSCHHQTSSSYALFAVFPRVDGLEIGSEIRLAGVKIGHVEKIMIDPKTWQARVKFLLRKDVSLPTDSNAIITSDSLLGGKYIALTPGGDAKTLHPQDTILDTQGTISLEELMSKFLFSTEGKTTSSSKSS